MFSKTHCICSLCYKYRTVQKVNSWTLNLTQAMRFINKKRSTSIVTLEIWPNIDTVKLIGLVVNSLTAFSWLLSRQSTGHNKRCSRPNCHVLASCPVECAHFTPRAFLQHANRLHCNKITTRVTADHIKSWVISDKDGLVVVNWNIDERIVGRVRPTIGKDKHFAFLTGRSAWPNGKQGVFLNRVLFHKELSGYLTKFQLKLTYEQNLTRPCRSIDPLALRHIDKDDRCRNTKLWDFPSCHKLPMNLTLQTGSRQSWQGHSLWLAGFVASSRSHRRCSDCFHESRHTNSILHGHRQKTQWPVGHFR